MCVHNGDYDFAMHFTMRFKAMYERIKSATSQCEVLSQHLYISPQIFELNLSRDFIVIFEG